MVILRYKVVYRIAFNLLVMDAGKVDLN